MHEIQLQNVSRPWVELYSECLRLYKFSPRGVILIPSPLLHSGWSAGQAMYMEAILQGIMQVRSGIETGKPRKEARREAGWEAGRTGQRKTWKEAGRERPDETSRLTDWDYRRRSACKWQHPVVCRDLWRFDETSSMHNVHDSKVTDHSSPEHCVSTIVGPPVMETSYCTQCNFPDYSLERENCNEFKNEVYSCLGCLYLVTCYGIFWLLTKGLPVFTGGSRTPGRGDKFPYDFFLPTKFLDDLLACYLSS